MHAGYSSVCELLLIAKQVSYLGLLEHWDFWFDTCVGHISYVLLSCEGTALVIIRISIQGVLTGF